MRVLLDTNVLLWAFLTPARLGAEAWSLIQDEASEVVFSAASIWKIAIKARLRRADFTVRPEIIAQEARDIGFTELSINSDTAMRVADLPLHHGDPFDRLLIAQAIAGPMRFLTADPILQRYSDLVTLVG